MVLALTLLAIIQSSQRQTPSKPDRVQFTTDSENWIATLNGKTLWKEPFDYERRADSANYTALTSGEILMVNRLGIIVAKLPRTCTYDPKVMIFCGDAFVYTTENWGWRYEKTHTAESRFKNMLWLSENRPLRIFDIKKKKLIYHGTLYSFGLPVQGRPGFFTSLYHRNRTTWMLHPEKTPEFDLREIRLRDMKVVKRRRLEGNTEDLKGLANNYWSNMEGPTTSFDWSKDREVDILGTKFSFVK